jgi:uncharacterized 2Fe-2S/4Fe-4S cluster protein (DUF4445 family)
MTKTPPADTDATANIDQAWAVFMPSGRRAKFTLGTPLLQAARQLGVDVDSVCGGRGLCGRCQITVSEGHFAKFAVHSQATHLSPRNAVEAAYDQRQGLAAERRLSCAALLAGDVVIDVPADSQVHKQIVRKRPEVRDIDIQPVTRLHYVEVSQPSLHEPTGDFRRLCENLRQQWPDWGINDDLTCDHSVLQNLQRALRDGDWKVTVAIRKGQHVVAIWPGFRDQLLGLAVDIGSTTMSGHLCDLATGEVLNSVGVMNPQIRFGEDLMSRVSYVMMNPGGEVEMTRVVREAVNHMATQATAEIGAGPEDILDLVFVGNPVMHHLMLGLDPTELGGAPFALAIDSAVNRQASELDLRLNPGARVYALPCIAGHVGADTAAVILSEAPQHQDAITLIVDVGTNAELVLGNRDRLVAASSPTGPAFEGAQIYSGQRAAPGAIERVRIDPHTLEPRFKIIGCDSWSDTPEFSSASARIGITGICGSGIIEAVGEMLLAGIISADGVINGALAERSPRLISYGRSFGYQLHGDITVTQTDVRAIQLAKAALYAGARLLMEKLNVTAVDRVVLAGAFGSHIDTKYAMLLGMIPDCDLHHVWSAGNAAGTGARIALLNRHARREIEQLVRQVEKVETAIEPKFQDHFVAAMAIPHRDDTFPELAKVVKLPAPETPTNDQHTGRRRRRRRG